MANVKITDLSDIGTPTATDVLPIVDDVSGTPVTKKVSYSNLVPAASESAAGIIEIATTAEIDTGTSETLAVAVDNFNESIHGIKYIELHAIDDSTTVTTGDGKMRFFVPPQLNGMNLVDADAAVVTVSSSGTPTIQIANVTDTVDILSTRITIDANEKTSYTAAAAPVINASNDDVATGDELRVDVDVAGTSTAGLYVILGFRLP